MTASPSLKILVVDDEDAGRYLKSHLLKRAGYDVTSVGRGADALAAVGDAPPMLVILDVKLPDMSGIDVCRRIKAEYPGVLVLQTSAAFTSRQDRAVGLEGGADSYLVEPIEPDELLASVKALARLAETERALRDVNAALGDKLTVTEREVMRAAERLKAETEGRARAEQILHHSQKLDVLGQLTGGIAHDFNNLLTVIIGNLETLQRQMRKPGADLAKIGQAAENAMRGAHRAAAITQRLLAFSRRQDQRPDKLDANRLIEALSHLMRRTLGEDISIGIDLAPKLEAVVVDPSHFESALLNIAVNARDAMPTGGSLAIATRNVFIDLAEAAPLGLAPGRYVSVSLADTGIGMDETVLAYAFEPFFTTKDVGHGTGLGLAQVYGFARQSGGTVTLKSKHGAGTTVTIYLPAGGAAPRSDESLGDLALDVPAVRDRTILVVEDDPDVRAHSTDLLQEMGYRVLEAGTSREALEIIDRKPEIDLLFTDIGLPGGTNGRQLADKALVRRPDLKVLFTTGYGKNSMRVGAAADLSGDVITKPFTLPDLAQRIYSLLAPAKASGTILLVDDEALIRMAAVDTLKERGYDVAEAGSAAEALVAFREANGAIHAAIVDLGLPDQPGERLIGELRALNADLPIIVVSGGYGDPQARERLQELGVSGVLEKPYAAHQLEALLVSLGVGLAAGERAASG